MKINEATSNGVYSLEKGWLKKPVKDDIPENVDLEPELSEWKEKAEACKTQEEIDAFIDGIYKLRQESILTDGEFGKGNLIFKELRNAGTLQKLKDAKVELENQEMSLPETNIFGEPPVKEEWEERLERTQKKCEKDYRFWACLPEDAKLNEQVIDEKALIHASMVNNYDYNDLKELLFGGDK